MIPGLVNGPPFPEGAIQGAVVAVASAEKPSVPTFVGVCEIDVAGLGNVQGARGHAVRGVQWEGDELWAWSSSGRPGQPSPEHLDGWTDTTYVQEELGELKLEDSDKEEIVGEADGGVSLNEERPESNEQEEKWEPSTKGKYPIQSQTQKTNTVFYRHRCGVSQCVSICPLPAQKG
jgi:translation initiation factor 2D